MSLNSGEEILTERPLSRHTTPRKQSNPGPVPSASALAAGHLRKGVMVCDGHGVGESNLLPPTGRKGRKAKGGGKGKGSDKGAAAPSIRSFLARPPFGDRSNQGPGGGGGGGGKSAAGDDDDGKASALASVASSSSASVASAASGASGSSSSSSSQDNRAVGAAAVPCVEKQEQGPAAAAAAMRKRRVIAHEEEEGDDEDDDGEESDQEYEESQVPDDSAPCAVCQQVPALHAIHTPLRPNPHPILALNSR